MDGVELHIEIESGFYKEIEEDLTHGNVEILRKTIQHHLKSACLVTMDIVVNIPKAFPVQKEKRFVSLISGRMKSFVCKFHVHEYGCGNRTILSFSSFQLKYRLE